MMIEQQPIESTTIDDRQVDTALLFGRDSTPGIVSVIANRAGQATVWRRTGAGLVRESDRFPNWFLLGEPRLLEGVEHQRLTWDSFDRDAWSGGVALIELQGAQALRYLVLTDRLDSIEPTLVENY